MKPLDSFIIQFRGLKPGIHRYNLQIDKTFFNHFEQSEISEGDLTVHIDLEKEERMLLFQFDIDGNVTLPCDRCTDPVTIPIHGNERLIVKFGEAFQELDEEIQIIPESETSFDVSPFLYEYIHLLLPMKRVHEEDDKGSSSCNPDMLNKLNELLYSRTQDPRWEKLDKLRGTKDEG
ncbi:MAG: DUF177 domain-containing protein [Bacteroidales bacterium]|nr:DUF177 domain-containing protein [Bacteroidales bacterium]